MQQILPAGLLKKGKTLKKNKTNQISTKVESHQKQQRPIQRNLHWIQLKNLMEFH